MACLDSNLVSKYVSAKLAPAEERSVEAHLDECAECRRLVSALVSAEGSPAGDSVVTQTVQEPSLARWTQPTDPLIGSVLLDYRLLRRIGAGGMGTVYEAEHTLIGKRAAVKVLRADAFAEPELCQRMLDEARIVNAIRHPGLVDIFGFGTTADGRPFLVMELLEGKPLDKYLAQRGPLEVPEALRIVLGVLAPLGAAHAAGVVHRDLKPSNIFLVDGSSRRVKLLDFGIAKIKTLGSDCDWTSTGKVFGTPGFMAPEQLRGEQVTPASDLYSLGCVLFELLTAERVFEVRSIPEAYRLHAEAAPTPPSARLRSLPKAVDFLVLDLLRKSPSERPQSTDQVRASVEQLLEAPGGGREEPARPRRGRSWAVALSAVTVVLLAVAAGAAFLRSEEPKPDPAVEPSKLEGEELVAEPMVHAAASAQVEPPAARVPPPEAPRAPVRRGQDGRSRSPAKAGAPSRKVATTRPEASREEGALEPRRGELRRRAEALERRLARARTLGRSTELEEATAALVRNKLDSARTEADLDALERVLADLEQRAR